jgi:hypothetical protein
LRLNSDNERLFRHSYKMLAHRATRTEIVPRRVVEAWSRVNCRILALYRIKWNQFTPNVPTEALHVTTRLKSFCWRVQQLAGNGGFAPPPDHCGSKKSRRIRQRSQRFRANPGAPTDAPTSRFKQPRRRERVALADALLIVSELQDVVVGDF